MDNKNCRNRDYFLNARYNCEPTEEQELDYELIHRFQLVKCWPRYKTMERAGSIKGNKSWETHTECLLVSVRHKPFFY